MDKKQILEQCYMKHMLPVFKTQEIATEKARQYITLMDTDEYHAIMDAMEEYADSRPKPLTAIELANKLFMIHSHPDIVQGTEGIVYMEEDIVKLLKELGYPDPDWEGNAAEMTKNS